MIALFLMRKILMVAFSFMVAFGFASFAIIIFNCATSGVGGAIQ